MSLGNIVEKKGGIKLTFKGWQVFGRNQNSLKLKRGECNKKEGARVPARDMGKTTIWNLTKRGYDGGGFIFLLRAEIRGWETVDQVTKLEAIGMGQANTTIPHSFRGTGE